jgi:hypothetical protein
MKFKRKIPKVKKKKATKKEIEELREIIIEIQQNPITMRQIKKFIKQTV